MNDVQKKEIVEAVTEALKSEGHASLEPKKVRTAFLPQSMTGWVAVLTFIMALSGGAIKEVSDGWEQEKEIQLQNQRLLTLEKHVASEELHMTKDQKMLLAIQAVEPIKEDMKKMAEQITTLIIEQRTMANGQKDLKDDIKQLSEKIHQPDN